jgi:hypothetical protein
MPESSAEMTRLSSLMSRLESRIATRSSSRSQCATRLAWAALRVAASTSGGSGAATIAISSMLSNCCSARSRSSPGAAIRVTQQRVPPLLKNP